MWDYTDKVKDLYTDPKNVGQIEDADVVVEVGSIVCGDALKLYLKIDENEIITEAKFETFGCGSAIASSEALTEMIVGKKVEVASKITNKDIAEFLGGLPEEKMHCSVMGNEALDKAISKWKGEELEEHDDLDGEVVCKCFGVTDTLIKKVVRDNSLSTVEEVMNYTKAGGACGSCIPAIEDLIEDVLNGKDEIVEKKEPLTNLKRMQLVEKTIAEEIRPLLQRDGGDLELIDIDGKKVYVSLRGACATCAVSTSTLKNVVEMKLKELVEDDIEVYQK